MLEDIIYKDERRHAKNLEIITKDERDLMEKRDIIDRKYENDDEILSAYKKQEL